MSGTHGNAHTLVMRIFESWRTENVPRYDEATAFEVFASELTMRPYGLALDEIESGIVGGGQDGGIDAVYVFFDDNLLDEDSEVVGRDSRPADFGQGRALELWVIQAKKAASFEETALDRLDGSVRRILDLNQSLDDLAALYNSQLLARISIFRSAWEKLITRRPKVRVHIVYATSGNTRNINAQVEAKQLALKATVDAAVPGADDITVALHGDSELLALYSERPSYSLPMTYQESLTSQNSHIALVRLSDYLALIVDENGRIRRHLFESNVRDFQGRVSVNQEIGESLQNADGPEFWWLNNGVTMICSSAITNNKTYSLTDIQIVNGLQTSYKIYDILKGDIGHPSLERMVLVRIVVTSDAATRDQVIRATNRQTNVTDASLRATDEVQRNIETYFLTRGWYYDRRKNYYKNEGKEASKIVGIPLLGAGLTAMGTSRADKSRGKPSSLLKNDDDYKSVFHPAIDLAIYFWVAKTQRRVNEYLFSVAPATQSEKNNLKFHLSMLMVQSVLGFAPKHPQQLQKLAAEDREFSDDELRTVFADLRMYYEKFVRTQKTPLETAAKSQRFSDYLIECAAKARTKTPVRA
jgi:hypothetical protein